jgi:hypothetical protein
MVAFQLFVNFDTQHNISIHDIAPGWGMPDWVGQTDYWSSFTATPYLMGVLGLFGVETVYVFSKVVRDLFAGCTLRRLYYLAETILHSVGRILAFGAACAGIVTGQKIAIWGSVASTLLLQVPACFGRVRDMKGARATAVPAFNMALATMVASSVLVVQGNASFDSVLRYILSMGVFAWMDIFSEFEEYLHLNGASSTFAVLAKGAMIDTLYPFAACFNMLVWNGLYDLLYKANILHASRELYVGPRVNIDECAFGINERGVAFVSLLDKYSDMGTEEQFARAAFDYFEGRNPDYNGVHKRDAIAMMDQFGLGRAGRKVFNGDLDDMVTYDTFAEVLASVFTRAIMNKQLNDVNIDVELVDKV